MDQLNFNLLKNFLKLWLFLKKPLTKKKQLLIKLFNVAFILVIRDQPGVENVLKYNESYLAGVFLNLLKNIENSFAFYENKENIEKNFKPKRIILNEIQLCCFIVAL